MMSTFITPIALLSVFPHQEPRFIIPALFPLVFLYAPELNQVPNMDIVRKFTDDGESCASAKPQKRKPRKLVLWYISNLLLTLFYGFMHQGGVFPLTSHIAAELRAKPHLTHIHLYTSYSYSLPTALLQLRNTHRVYRSSSNHKYMLTQDFHLYEQGSERLPRVFDNIIRKIRNCEEKFDIKRIPYRLYYALPASAISEFEKLWNDRPHSFRFHVVKGFYPHISVERLPHLKSLDRLISLPYLRFDDIFTSFVMITKEFYEEYLKQMQLLLLKIEYIKPKARLGTVNKH